MYKIYINEVPVLLMSTQDMPFFHVEIGARLIEYSGRVRDLKDFVLECEKGMHKGAVILHYHQFDVLKKDFKSLFGQISAAGGLVQNNKNEFLFIFRRGFWDLPKGKLEPNEKKKETAIREVQEETGATNLEIIKKIAVTRHTYKNRNGLRIIKKSHWFLMRTTSQKLRPQKSEDITKAIWMDLNYFFSNCTPVFKNIVEVLQAYQAMEHMHISTPLPTPEDNSDD